MVVGGFSHGAVTVNGIPLDFNQAYNPTYTCPIPPAENHLKMAVKAGERAFEAH